ncbi:F-box/kelch-repeat protein-like protein [Tanacetum coccineum]
MAPLVTEDDKGGLCLSFGYDSSTDDYKVLLAIRKSYDGTVGALFLIFSMKSNTWKLIGQFNYWFLHNLPGIFFNGALHWFAFDYNASEQKKRILSFDLSREEFNVIPHPNDSKYVSGLSFLGVMEDQLSIFFVNKDNDLPLDIWVMRSYNVEQSWELLPSDCEMKHEVVHFMKMLHCASPMNNMMSFFCDDNKSLLKAWKYVRAHRFVPSLLSPYVNIGKPSHPKNNKTSVKAWGDMTIFRPWSIEVGFFYFILVTMLLSFSSKEK